MAVMCFELAYFVDGHPGKISESLVKSGPVL